MWGAWVRPKLEDDGVSLTGSLSFDQDPGASRRQTTTLVLRQEEAAVYTSRRVTDIQSDGRRTVGEIFADDSSGDFDHFTGVLDVGR